MGRASVTFRDDKHVMTKANIALLPTSFPVKCWNPAQGSCEQPFCRFSKAAVAALQQTGVPFDTFDIFTVRHSHHFDNAFKCEPP